MSLVGGDIDVPENAAFSKDCGTGCLKQCDLDCGGGSKQWEDDPFSGFRNCLVNGYSQNISSGCRVPASTLCADVWASGHRSVQSQWVTPAKTGTQVCNKARPCTGSSTGGTVRCVGAASDWLTPYTSGMPLTDELVLKSIGQHHVVFPNDVDGHNTLMSMFCSGTSLDGASASCAERTDPITGQKTPQTSCSRYNLAGPIGTTCMQWVNSLSKTDGTYVGITTAHCAKAENLQSPECACINAALQDHNYYILKPKINAPDYCWYIPCNQPAQNFIKPDDFAAKCPDTCVQYIDAEKGAGITGSFFIQTQNCDGGGGGDGKKALLLAVLAGTVVLVAGLLIARLLLKKGAAAAGSEK